MKKCTEPFFDICGECDKDTTGICIAEREYMKKIIAKLDENEMMFLIWLLAKAKGADAWDEERFAKALAHAMGEAQND